MISKADLLKNRDQQYPQDYTPIISANLDLLLGKMEQIETALGSPMVVDSGWRSPAENAIIPGAAAHSKHMIGLAADIADVDAILWAWVLQNLPLMKSLGIFLEDKRWTPSWVHFQFGPPASGHRIFTPNASRAWAPNIWNGVYDRSFDEAA